MKRYYYANLVVHEVDHEGSVDLIRKIKEVYKSLNEIASDQNTNRKYICSTVSIQSYSSNYSSSKSKYTQITLLLPLLCSKLKTLDCHLSSLKIVLFLKS